MPTTSTTSTITPSPTTTPPPEVSGKLNVCILYSVISTNLSSELPIAPVVGGVIAGMLIISLLIGTIIIVFGGVWYRNKKHSRKCKSVFYSL